MLDYLKGDITPEDRQRMTELLHKDASCREKYREMSRAYAIASVPWFERRKKQNLDFLREKLDLRSSPGRTLVRRVRELCGNGSIIDWPWHSFYLFE